MWNPGDGSDTVFGGTGSDTLLFNGANVNEKINIAANGGGFTFTRDVANITMSVSQVETIEFNALGGADTITIGDLTGTGRQGGQRGPCVAAGQWHGRRRSRQRDRERHRQ